MGSPEVFTLTIVLIIFFGFVIGMPYAVMSEKRWIPNQLELCENKGGTLLRNTYKEGRSTSSNLVCVKPDVIIEL